MSETSRSIPRPRTLGPTDQQPAERGSGRIDRRGVARREPVQRQPVERVENEVGGDRYIEAWRI